MDDRRLLRRRLRPAELIGLDALAAGAYVLVGLLGILGRGPTAPPWLIVAAAVTIALPLVVRRRWPLPVFGVVLVASLAGLVLGVVRDPLLAAAYALYPVAVAEPRPRREPTLGIGILSLVLLVGSTVVGPAGPPAAMVGLTVLGAAVLGGVWTVGRAIRERRVYAARAARQLATRAVTEERLRIARELHDVVSHTLSMIGVKAGIANHVADSRPAEARDALRVIEATSRDALTEMRHMLGILRDPAAPPTSSSEPADGLGAAALERLVERAAAAGVAVELVVGGIEKLPRGLELSVERIVREAVTNVIKHAAPARCRVVVAGDATEVRIEVTDDGRGAGRDAGAPPGHGLVGMRERAMMFGGEFDAGPRPDGGFRVAVRLPIGERS